jgi:hypothetical protein
MAIRGIASYNRPQILRTEDRGLLREETQEVGGNTLTLAGGDSTRAGGGWS